MSFKQTQAVFLRYWYNLKKGPQQLSDLFYWPLIDIMLWGITAVWMQAQSPNPKLSLILLSGLIFWQVTWRGSIDFSVSLLHELWHRNLINLFSTPMRLQDWYYGVTLFSLCKLAVTISFGSFMVYLLYGLNVFEIGWTTIPFMTTLLIFGWAVGLIASSAIIYWGHQIEALAWMVGFVFAPFCGVFYPVEVLPGWVQTIAWYLPPTYVFEGLRSILNHGTYPTNYLWISFGLSLLYLCGSLFLFQFMFEKSRKKGLGRLV